MSKDLPLLNDRVVGRLIAYRRALAALSKEGREFVFSHELGELTGVTAAQLRRDLMPLGFLGNPARGYEVPRLLECLVDFLDRPGGQSAVLVGVGNLGRALLTYSGAGSSHVRIRAAFDADPAKAGKQLGEVKVHDMSCLRRVVRRLKPEVGMIAVPVTAAVEVAQRLVECDVTGLLNFAPCRMPGFPGVYVESIDLSLSLERVAFLARQSRRTADQMEQPPPDGQETVA